MKAGTVCLLVSLCYPDPTIQDVQSPARKLMMCRARGWLAKIIGKLSQSLLLLATQTLWLSIRGAQETWVLAVPLLLLLTENTGTFSKDVFSQEAVKEVFLGLFQWFLY